MIIWDFPVGEKGFEILLVSAKVCQVLLFVVRGKKLENFCKIESFFLCSNLRSTWGTCYFPWLRIILFLVLCSGISLSSPFNQVWMELVFQLSGLCKWQKVTATLFTACSQTTGNYINCMWIYLVVYLVYLGSLPFLRPDLDPYVA